MKNVVLLREIATGNIRVFSTAGLISRLFGLNHERIIRGLRERGYYMNKQYFIERKRVEKNTAT